MTSITRFATTVATAALVSVSFACTDPEPPPPAAPVIEVDTDRYDVTDDRITTRLPHISFGGTAEYGSTVRLSRTPALPGAHKLEATAHPHSGRFEFEGVPLVEGTNEFQLVAIDSRDQTSPSAKLVVVYDPLPNDFTLTLSSDSVTAGPGSTRGEITITARFEVNEHEAAAFTDREVTFELSGASNQSKTALTDDEGVALAEFSGLDLAGTVTVEVTSGDLTSVAEFVVRPGPAAQLSMGLRASGQSGQGTSSLTVPAGTVVNVHTSLSDASGNTVDAPVSVATTAPGASVSGTRISNLHVAGTYRVVAAVSGAETEGDNGVSGEAVLTVLPASSYQVELSAPSTVVAGKPFQVATRVVDAFGNRLDDESAALVLSSDDPLFDSANLTSATLRTAGNRTLTAKLPDSEITASVTIEVRPAAMSSLSVVLSSPNAVAGQAAFAVRADENARVDAQATVNDAYGNTINAPVEFTTTYPGSAVVDGSISALEVAGEYRIAATLPDRALADEVSFAVLPADATTIEFALERTVAAAGEAVPYSAFARDRFGNVTADALTVDSEDVAVAVDNNTVAIEQVSNDDAPWILTASAPDLELESVTATLAIVPDAPANVTLTWDAENDTVVAGEEVEVATVVTDRFGNLIADAELEFLVNPLPGTQIEAPGPYVSDNRLTNLTRAGQFSVVAQVVGSEIGTDPNAHVLVVEPGEPTSLVVEAAPSAYIGWPVDVSVNLYDGFGNSISDLSGVVLSVHRDDVEVAQLTEATWTPSEAGEFLVRGELELDDGTVSGEAPVTVTHAPDNSIPLITLQSPSGHRTTSQWPPDDAQASNSCEGIEIHGLIEDDSDIETVWLTLGGVVDLPTTERNPPAGTRAFALEDDLCKSDLLSTTRGEVAVELAAVDIFGNYAKDTASWCIDPDSDTYLPSSSPLDRCVIENGSLDYGATKAVAVNRSGRELVLAEIDVTDGDAALRLVPRFPYTGPGAAHVLSGFKLPRSVAFVGNTAYTTTQTGTGSDVIRTSGLNAAGDGNSKAVIRADSTTHRFHGILITDDGSLYTTWAMRTGAAGGSRVDRFDANPEEGSITFDPDSTAAFAESASLNVSHLCGFHQGDLIGAGRNQIGRPVVVRIANGTISPLWNYNQTSEVVGCAVNETGVVVNVEVASSTPFARTLHIDLSQTPRVAVNVFTGFSSATPIWSAGPAEHDGVFYFVTEDGFAKGALMRLTAPVTE